LLSDSDEISLRCSSECSTETKSNEPSNRIDVDEYVAKLLMHINFLESSLGMEENSSLPIELRDVDVRKLNGYDSQYTHEEIENLPGTQQENGIIAAYLKEMDAEIKGNEEETYDLLEVNEHGPSTFTQRSSSIGYI
jgi:hypothetical protein